MVYSVGSERWLALMPEFYTMKMLVATTRTRAATHQHYYCTPLYHYYCSSSLSWCPF
jgi:hypothetical protein